MARSGLTAHCHLPTPNKTPNSQARRRPGWQSRATLERSRVKHFGQAACGLAHRGGTGGGQACWPTRPRWAGARRPRRQRGRPGRLVTFTDVVAPQASPSPTPWGRVGRPPGYGGTTATQQGRPTASSERQGWPPWARAVQPTPSTRRGNMSGTSTIPVPGILLSARPRPHPVGRRKYDVRSRRGGTATSRVSGALTWLKLSCQHDGMGGRERGLWASQGLEQLWSHPRSRAGALDATLGGEPKGWER